MSVTRVTAAAATRAAKRTMWASLLGNFVLVAIKGSVGLLTQSQALIADAVHSLADTSSDVLAYVAVKIGRHEADASHPYGHGKFETFGTLLLAALLGATGLGILWHAFEAIRAGEIPHDLGPLALAAATFSIVLKELLFRYCLREGEAVRSKAIIANAWHHRSDSLSSIAALIGLGLSILGYPIFDAIAAAIVAAILLHMTWQMGREAFDELVDAAIPEATQQRFTRIMQKTDGVIAVHDLRARRLGADLLVDAHVEVDPFISVSEGHRIAELVEYRLKQAAPEVSDVVVHIDPAHHDHKDAPEPQNRAHIEEQVRDIVRAVLPGTEVVLLTLHFIDDDCYGDVVLHHRSAAKLEAARDKLFAALQAPKGPFSRLTLSRPL